MLTTDHGINGTQAARTSKRIAEATWCLFLERRIDNSIDSEGQGIGIYAFNYNLAVILKRE